MCIIVATQKWDKNKNFDSAFHLSNNLDEKHLKLLGKNQVLQLSINFSFRMLALDNTGFTFIYSILFIPIIFSRSNVKIIYNYKEWCIFVLTMRSALVIAYWGDCDLNFIICENYEVNQMHILYFLYECLVNEMIYIYFLICK